MLKSFNSCPRTEGNAAGAVRGAWSGMFQFMPSHGGQRRAQAGDRNDEPCFNSCPRTEGNRHRIRRFTSRWTFQFMPSHGGQPFSRFGHSALAMFQFMPSHGGQPPALARCGGSKTFQFMPSHGGQPAAYFTGFCLSRVSIHALARRATGIQLHLNGLGSVSIHALARRATVSQLYSNLLPLLFQFMPSHGGQQGAEGRKRPA